MNARRIVTLGLVFVCLLSLPPGMTGAQETSPQEAAAPEAMPALITPLFSYQGRLVEGGVPVTGDRDMTFRLWTASSLGSKVWEEGPKSVAVSKGLFTATLGDTTVLPVDWFGYQLWLEVQVGAVTLPRQRLMGAPYAFSLVPGAQVVGSKPPGDPAVVTVENAGTGTALYATSNGSAPTMQAANTSATGGAAQLDSNGTYYTAMFTNSYAGVNNQGGVMRLNSNGGRFILAQDKSFNQRFSVDFNGDVTQSRTAGGLVKFAIAAMCTNSGSTIDRYYTQGVIPTISDGTTPGTCTINPGFDPSDRYWTATAVSTAARLATCNVSGGQLSCLRTDSAGNGISGAIQIVIY